MLTNPLFLCKTVNAYMGRAYHFLLTFANGGGKTSRHVCLGNQVVQLIRHINTGGFTLYP